MGIYYEIDVSLLGIKPKIWRRFHLPPMASFGDLNQAIQFCGPWYGEHLWKFMKSGRNGKVIGELKYPGSAQFGWDEAPAPDADNKQLDSVLRAKGDDCLYWYDFGDDWRHEVKLRKVFESDEKFDCRLIDGDRNFPPEDCGGVWGYCECLYALGKIDWDGPPDQEPSKADLKDRREWLGDWDPEKFNLDAVKAEFDHPKPRKVQIRKRQRS